MCTTHSFALWQICGSQVWDVRCNWRHIYICKVQLFCLGQSYLYYISTGPPGDNNISKKDNTCICIKGALFQYISKIGIKLWFYKCCFTPFDVSASCFLPVTDSLWFNVLVLTKVYCFTLEGLYLGSNLVQSWQYFDTWCGPSANLECRSEMCCWRLAANTGCKKTRQKSPSGHHRTTLSGCIFANTARIDSRKKTC